MESDCRVIPTLDAYNQRILDDSAYGTVSKTDRLCRRDLEESHMQQGLLYDESTCEGELPVHCRTHAGHAAEGSVSDDEEMVESIENLEDLKGHTVQEWVTQLGPKTEIYNRFKNFLRTYVDEQGHNLYKEKIKQMCEGNGHSLEVSYTTLATADQMVAYFLPEAPSEVLVILDEAAKDIVLGMFPQYERITGEIRVRITDLPLIEEICSLCRLDPNQSVRTAGVTTNVTGTLLLLFLIKYICVKCGHVLGPFVELRNWGFQPGPCPECRSVGPFAVKREQCRPRCRQADTALAPLRSSFLAMDDNEYGSECFPRSEYKTRFSETTAFEMSDPEYWGTYFRSTASDDDCDRLSNLKSKDYHNHYTNAPHATSVSAGTFHSPWQRTQYSEIFHATPEAPRLVYEPAFLYDLLLAYKKSVCVRVENLFNQREVADKKMEVYFANEYPCILVKIEEFNNVPKETRSLYNIAIAYFVAITNKIAQLDNIPVELVIRSSFGHNIPSVAQTRTSFRINIGIVPEIYTEVLVKSLIELNDRVLVPLFNLKFLLNLDAVQIKNHNEEVAKYNDRKKSNEKSQLVSMWSENEALFKILTKVGDYTGRRVSAHIIRREKHIDLLANYVSEELDRSQPNLGNPLIKLLGQLSYCERLVLNVAEEDYNKISLHKFSVEEENSQIKKDFVFWRIMQYVVLALDVRGIPEAMDARRLTGLYGTLEKLNLEFIRNSGCQEAQDGCGSDSDCEVCGAPAFYSKKLTVATGMRAINLAQFLSIYHLRQSGFNPRAYAEKCFFETKEAIETVSDIFTLLGLQGSTQQHRGDATVRYIDLSYCAACGPESISMKDVLNRISKNDVVVLDYTSTNTEKISMAVSIFIKKVEVVILVNSGLKNEQLGADMNPYGTIRIVAKDRRLLNELYFVLKKVLEQGEELLPKHLHRIRKAYKNAGAVVTNKAIYKMMCRKSSGDLDHEKSIALKSSLSKEKFNTLAC